MGAAGLCPERPPGLLYHARAPLFGRGSMLQTRFCLCTQYCHWTRAGAISALPIRAFRACGCCGPMPRRPPDSSATRALLSLAVAVCYRCASACAHSTVATPAGNAHRACQVSRALIPACGLYVKRPVSDSPPASRSLALTLKGGGVLAGGLKFAGPQRGSQSSFLVEICLVAICPVPSRFDAVFMRV